MSKIAFLAQDPNKVGVVFRSLLKSKIYSLDIFNSPRAFKNYLKKYQTIIIYEDFENNLELIVQLKQQVDPPPRIFFLSFCRFAGIRIRALRAGADEAMCLPLDLEEFDLRLKRIMRIKEKSNKILQVGNISYNQNSQIIRVAGQIIHLRRKERQILEILLIHKNQVVSREKLIDLLWPESPPTYGTINSYLARINRSLGEASYQLITIWGLGYKITDGLD